MSSFLFRGVLPPQFGRCAPLVNGNFKFIQFLKCELASAAVPGQCLACLSAAHKGWRRLLMLSQTINFQLSASFRFAAVSRLVESCFFDIPGQNLSKGKFVFI